MHLKHFPFECARFLYSIRFLGDLLWDNPFLGQGQDLSSFDPTKIHTTDHRYVVHEASSYSTLQSLFEHFFFPGCQLIPDLNRLYCSRNCGHAPALQHDKFES